MALSTLSTVANEQGSIIITVSFADENGDAVTPDELTWTLTDMAGTVINERKDVAVAAEDLDSSVGIFLSGDDLAVASLMRETLVLTVEGTYTGAFGSGMPVTAAVNFFVQNLPGVQ